MVEDNARGLAQIQPTCSLAETSTLPSGGPIPMRPSQSQEGGDQSLNIQAQGDVSFGLDYRQTREVAMDVFRANFLQLRDEAAELAFQRAEALINDFLQQAAADGLVEIPEGKNPDFQYAVFSAQREYARSGDEDMGELLVQLLVDRAKIQDRDLTQIVLNESLSVAPKLTLGQFDWLSLIFLLKYQSFGGVRDLPDLYAAFDKFFPPFLVSASRKESASQHLEYAGAATHNAVKMEAPLLLTRSHPGFFKKGHAEQVLDEVGLSEAARVALIVPSQRNPALHEINAANSAEIDVSCQRFGLDRGEAEKLKNLFGRRPLSIPELRAELIAALPWMAQLFDLWDNTPIQNLTLTSVGIAIARANIKRKTGQDFALSNWM